MLTVIQADITTLHVDAIVNAALGLRRLFLLLLRERPGGVRGIDRVRSLETLS